MHCNIVNDGAAPFWQIRPVSEIVANEAAHERRSCPMGDRNTREVQILTKNVEGREQAIGLRISKSNTDGLWLATPKCGRASLRMSFVFLL